MGDVAVVGFSFKLPGGLDTVSGFWEALESKKSLMTNWPASRINSNAFHNAELARRTKLYSQGGYFINDDPGAFDSPFFSITAAEAASMDPMQRWTLEAAYRAFENAGIPMKTLKGSRTAVFSASMTDDYSRMMSKDPETASRMAITGTFSSILPNRVSWFFDLLGPSVHIDTACSSSLVAVDLACQSLSSGDASMALVTGSNLILGPDGFFLLSNLDFLSPDSKSYSFDNRANGYARGEGIIALLLKPLNEAVRAGDMIRAVIRSTGTNQDGRTLSLTQPSSEAQEELIRRVYKKANLSLDLTRYIEAHGTGTPVGDPIEMKAIGRVFGSYRSREDPLYVGSVKANIGHLEGCSGLAGVIKSIMILERGVIVPNALFQKPNDSIDVKFFHTVVPTDSIPWPSPGPRRISVNSFGFGGTNTHIILDDAYHYLRERGLIANHCTSINPISNSLPPAIACRVSRSEVSAINGISSTSDGKGVNGKRLNGRNGHNTVFNSDSIPNGNSLTSTEGTNESTLNQQNTTNYQTITPNLLVWSAADEKGLQRVLQQYENYIETGIAHKTEMLRQLAYTLASRRSHMLWRAYSIVPNNLSTTSTKFLPSKIVRTSAELGVVFVFTGQGAQYTSMGLGLLCYPTFRETLREIDRLYNEMGCKWSIFDQILKPEKIDTPEYSQPLSTALQIALVELLKSFGITPNAVVGHSSGEIAAAYTTSSLTLRSACKVSYFRGQLVGKLKAKATSSGAMISVNLPHDQVHPYLKTVSNLNIEDSVHIACINSPLNCTLSGSEPSIDALKSHLDEKGIFAQKLNTGVAYHSPLMLIIANQYLSQMGKLEAGQRSAIPMISTVTGQPISTSILATGQYWVDNLVSPVLFSDAIQLITQKPATVKVGMGPISDLVEIGPHSTLKRSIQDTVAKVGNRKQTRYSSTLQRSKDAVESVLELLGHLFCHGHDINISAANGIWSSPPPSFLVDCPEYPFDHSHTYWAESRLSRDFRLREPVSGDLLGWRFHDWNPLEPRWRNLWSVDTTPWTGDHVVSNTIIYPAAGMLIMAMEAAREMALENRIVSGYYIKEAQFLSPIIIKEDWEHKTETILRLCPLQKPYEKQSTWSDIKLFARYDDRWSECFRATIQIQYEEQESEVDNGRETRLADEQVSSRYEHALDACTTTINSQRFYEDTKKHGIKYGEWFQILEDIHWDGTATSIARVSVTPKQQARLVHPAILDAAFHVLRVSITKGLTQVSGTHIPMSLNDGWFSASGWQASHTSSLRYMTIASGEAGREAREGTIYALADDNSTLCKIQRVVIAQVSKEDETHHPIKKLLYGVEWQPQLSLLDPDQLSRICNDDTFSKDEKDRPVWHEKLTFVLNTSLYKTLNQLTENDRLKIPNCFARHVKWMEYQARKISSPKTNIDISDEDLNNLLQELETLNPPWKLFTTVVRQLRRILIGEVDSLSVIFDSSLAELFYADMFNSICDHRLQRFITLASHENPQLRILEVGAGTGGMTSHILSTLIERERQTGGLYFSNYTYTDISPAFFENARTRWYEVGERITFKILDLEREIEDQGFELASYDLIVAGSVLHATADLGATIRNLHKILKQGGHMVLLEPISPENVITNFAFGLAPGWWNCQEEWRSISPAITEDEWHRCLKANGFSGNDLCLRDFNDESCHIFSIILTTAEAEQRPLGETHSDIKFFLVLNPQSNIQTTMATSLEKHFCSNLTNRHLEIVTLAQLEHARIADSGVVISLLEADKPFLATITQEEFQAFQHLIQSVNSLLWVTAPQLDDHQFALYGVAPGFLRSIRTENIESHLVMLSIERSDESIDALAHYVAKVAKTAFEGPSVEVEYVVRHGELITSRVIEELSLNDNVRSLVHSQLMHKPWSSGLALQLTVEKPGDLESLEFVEDANYVTPLGPLEVEIEAKAWGLSFRDIYVALGRLDDGDLGGDCAGIVTRVGSECTSGLKPEDRVCMISPGCMRAYPRAPESSVIRLPDELSFEAGASIVAPCITAYYSLIDVARLRKGERILIHSAAGSTGQMAIWIARLRGAEIFATVGSNEKKQFLIENFEIPEDHIFYSRSTSFAQGILRMTNSYGVDVVLNSLSGDGLRASWECIAPYGRFIEIGKADIMANSSLPMACFAKNVTFSAVDLVHLSQSNEELTARLLKDTLGLLEQGAQHPSPLHVYSVSAVEDAFRFLQSGKNTGRIVITADPHAIVPQRVLEKKTWKFDPQAAYVVAGGFGGIGRAIIKWMVDRGAKRLIILSRSGPVGKAAMELVSNLTVYGVNVFAPKCDASSSTSLAEVLRECEAQGIGPIKGCINAAMVLQDAVFENMTHAQWALTISSKVQSSWNLHRLLPGDLDFFVLLSSLAGICGTVAQSNYAGGCSAQDALARHRTSTGLNAISFDIGWMYNVGIIAETESYQRNRYQAADMQQVDEKELLTLLSIYCDPEMPLLPGAKSQVLIGLLTPADFLLQGQVPPQMHDRPFFGAFSHLGGQASSSASATNTDTPGTLFRLAKEKDERIQIVIHALSVKLARAMSILPDEVDPSMPLSNYGVDSLMAVELRNYIGREFQATVAVFDIMGGVPISSIGDLVVERSTVVRG